jgi:hypothetical protein
MKYILIFAKAKSAAIARFFKKWQALATSVGAQYSKNPGNH